MPGSSISKALVSPLMGIWAHELSHRNQQLFETSPRQRRSNYSIICKKTPIAVSGEAQSCQLVPRQAASPFCWVSPRDAERSYCCLWLTPRVWDSIFPGLTMRDLVFITQENIAESRLKKRSEIWTLLAPIIARQRREQMSPHDFNPS